MARKDGPASLTGRLPSARDVAERAGVSASTVSLVVNGKYEGRVSRRNQTAVRRAIDELGYRADPVARGLATGRRGTVAVIVPDLDSHFFNYVTMGVGMGLKADMQLLLAFGQPNDHDLQSMLSRILAMRVDGIICEGISAAALRSLSDVYCPVVVLDDPGTDWAGPTVAFDLLDGAEQLASHLVGLGHRHIAYLTPECDAPTFQVRRAALRERLAARLGSTMKFLVGNADTSIEAADRVVTDRWPAWERENVTALVCAADIQAYGALLALARLGVPVPEVISVAGFDDLPFSLVTGPPLTSVALSAHELGYGAARLLNQALQGGRVDPLTLPARLMIRQSTGPARYLESGTSPPRHRGNGGHQRSGV